MSYNKKMFREVCEFLGSNLDSKPCKMLRVHLEKCHNCEIFVDKIKKTVGIYKKSDRCDSLPENVSKKLYTILNLKNPDESITNTN